MKKGILSLLLVFTFIFLTGCESEPDDRIKMPSSSNKFEGSNYIDVLAELEEVGFTNIETVVLDDLITGWLTKDGEVEEIEVDGDTSFSAGSKYPADVKIIVTYHTFPVKGEKTTDGAEEETTTPLPEDQIPEEPEIKNLTVDNCEELAAILAIKGDHQSSFSEFAEKYRGEIIEFDGSIAITIQHPKYETRWIIGVQAGDYVDEDTFNPGPSFTFDNVHPIEMGMKSLDLPDYLYAGNNVRITAEVISYNYDTNIFELKPITVEPR